jgi:hypothetical protein
VLERLLDERHIARPGTPGVDPCKNRPELLVASGGNEPGRSASP